MKKWGLAVSADGDVGLFQPKYVQDADIGDTIDEEWKLVHILSESTAKVLSALYGLETIGLWDEIYEALNEIINLAADAKDQIT